MSGKRDGPTLFVMVVLGTTIHEFAGVIALLPIETRGWSDQVPSAKADIRRLAMTVG
jgi:hypothetical protein